MYDDPRLQLWLRRSLGQIAVDESSPIPPDELLVEIRKGGQWVRE